MPGQIQPRFQCRHIFTAGRRCAAPASANLPKTAAEPVEQVEEITLHDTLGPLAPEAEYTNPAPPADPSKTSSSTTGTKPPRTLRPTLAPLPGRDQILPIQAAATPTRSSRHAQHRRPGVRAH